MPLGYFVAAEGRAGAELRMARRDHELVATGPAARLGLLVPHITTTTTIAADGRPLEVRLPYSFVAWLILGCLVTTVEVAELILYEYVVGVERLGAALDAVLAVYDNDTWNSPSVLRRELLLLARQQRTVNPAAFTVTTACLLVVGGTADNVELAALAGAGWSAPPLAPAWMAYVTFGMLTSPDGTLAILSELEGVWAPRWSPLQRTANGGFTRFETLLQQGLSVQELAIINGLTPAAKALHYAELAVTLLPTAPEMVSYSSTSVGACLSLTRAFIRATSTSGALAVSVHDVLTVIQHYPPFAHAIGTDLGAPAALGLLQEAVRAALKSPTAQLALGNVAAAAELYQYLVGRLKEMQKAHSPPSARVTFMIGELAERRQHEASSRGSGSAGGGDRGGVSTAGGGGSGGSGYAAMHVGELCDIMADTSFIAFCGELSVDLDAHAPPASAIERILAYRGRGHAILHHALRGYVTAVRDLPIVARIYTELRPHGAQWVSDTVAELSLPPETEAAPRIIPDPQPDLWDGLCKARYDKLNLEDAIYAVLAQCGGHDGYVRIPDTAQYSSIERMRRTERTVVPLFGKLGFVQGDELSLDTVYATAYAYYDDATAVLPATRMKLIRSVMTAVLREASARDSALLEARKPGEQLPVNLVIPNSGGLARLQRGRLETPTATTMARSLSQILGPTKAKQLGLGSKLVPEGMGGGGGGGGGVSGGDPSPNPNPTPPVRDPKQREAGDAKETADDKAGVVGSGVKRFVDLSTPGQFGIGRGDRRQVVKLRDFYACPEVPKLPQVNGVAKDPSTVDLTDPGPNCCPVVWCSTSANPEAFCTAAGKPGHGRGGKAHKPPAEWRQKFVAGLLTAALAAAAPAPAASAAAPLGAGGCVPACFGGLPVAASLAMPLGDLPCFALPSLGPLANTPVQGPSLSMLNVSSFEAHGGHAFMPLWFPTPATPYLALPDGEGALLYGSDAPAVLAMQGGAGREAALAAAAHYRDALFSAEREDLVCFGFLRDEAYGKGEVAGFVASTPPPPHAERRRCETLDEAQALGDVGVRWVAVRALRDSPLGRLARLAVACARRFAEPSFDLTPLGVALGAMAPRPVAPAEGVPPIACDCARLTPAEVKQRALTATVKLRQEFARAIAEDGYPADERATLGELAGMVAPPAWGDMPGGLLEQATVPTDDLIQRVPYPAYCRPVTSDPLPPLPDAPPPLYALVPQPSPPLAVPGWATEWRHALLPDAAQRVLRWFQQLHSCLARFAAGEPGPAVLKSLPQSLAIGPDNFSPWAAALVRAGHIIVREQGRFALQDLSLPPDNFTNGTGFNRCYLGKMLDETGSTDHALRDMLLTHGAVYLDNSARILLLQPPLHSFFSVKVGFDSAHTEVGRMAALGWFSVQLCERLAQGEFDLPCLPFRSNRSGVVPRRYELRYRSIQDFGAPRTRLLLLPPPRFLPPPQPPPPPPVGLARGCGGLVGCLVASTMAVVPAGGSRVAKARPRLPRHLGHYFSGTYGLVGASARARGWSAREVDKLTGTNLRVPAVAAAELRRIANGDFGALLMGPPCSSFSPNLAEDGGKYQLRSWDWIDEGLPMLAPRLRARVDEHNEYVAFTYDAAIRQLRRGGELCIENSAGRYDPRSPAHWPQKAHLPPIWATRPMRRLRAEAAALGRPLELLHAPQCAFGPGPHGYLYQKWTEFLVTPATARRLRAFNALRCWCPPGAHTHARGYDESGASKSERAAAYPWLLCDCLVYGLTGDGARPAILGAEPPAEVCSPCEDERVGEDADALQQAPVGVATQSPLAAGADGGVTAERAAPEQRRRGRRDEVVSLNRSSGLHESRAVRAAFAAANPALAQPPRPRHTPALQSRPDSFGPRDLFPAGLVEPAPLGSAAWAGGRWSWPQELKPIFSHLLLAIVIVGHMAYLCGEDVYLVTDDCKDWFHQFALATLQCWACGMFRLDPASYEPGDVSAALGVVMAKCLEMGVSPSSNIAQRALTEILEGLSRRFAAAEEPHLRELERRFPRFAEARAVRRQLSAQTGRDEARCFCLFGYTDDIHAVLMGAASCVRYCVAHARHFGPAGCNVKMAIALKRVIGVSASFIGATALTVGQLAYVGQDKALRTHAVLSDAVAGRLTRGEWVKLTGLLNHLVCVLVMPYYCMYGVYGVLDDARARGLGPDDCLQPDRRGTKALLRWLDALKTTAGTTALAALYPVRRPAGSGVLHAMHSDAALKGTAYPAICGNLYNHVWVLPLRDSWRTLPIVATEFAGAIINVMVFAPMLQGAPGLLVVDALVVPLVMAGKASSPLMRFMHEFLVTLPEYALIADTLLVAHEYGPYNPVADAGSRGKQAELTALLQHLGLEENRVELPARAYDLLDGAALVWSEMGPAERAELERLELVGAREQPNLGSTERGVANLAMDGRPIAHRAAVGAGAACGGFIGCSTLLVMAMPDPAAAASSSALPAAAADDMGGATGCLLAAESLEHRDRAAQVRAAADVAAQALAAAEAARAEPAELRCVTINEPGAGPPAGLRAVPAVPR